MTDIKLNNDIELSGGDIALIEEPDAIGQRIRHRLLTFKGEWFLDLDFGPPYREQILVKNPRVEIVSAIIRAEILKSAAGDFADFSVEVNSKTRVMTTAFTLLTTSGSVTTTIAI